MNSPNAIKSYRSWNRPLYIRSPFFCWLANEISKCKRTLSFSPGKIRKLPRENERAVSSHKELTYSPRVQFWQRNPPRSRGVQLLPLLQMLGWHVSNSNWIWPGMTTNVMHHISNCILLQFDTHSVIVK